MRLLIVNNIYKNVLASIRSIGKSSYDINIDVASFNQVRIHRIFKSKYISRIFSVTNPVINFDKFESEISSLVISNKYDMIIPFGFISTVALSKLKQQLTKRGVILPTGDFETIIKAHDKEICLQAAENIGLSIPKTYKYDNLEELEKVIDRYPLIIKARRFSGIKKGFAVAENFDQLRKEYNRISNQSGDGEIVDFTKPIIQEFIDGNLYDSCFVISKGDVKSYVFQQRVMSTAGKIGPGIINETLNNDLKEEAFKYGEKLLREIGWEGASQVELIYDNKQNQFKLIEVNPKLWGTLELSIKAGVDFPLNMIRYYYFNEDIKPKEYSSMKFYWVWGIALFMIKQKKLDIKELSKLIRNENNEIDWRDLKPEIFKLINLISKSLKK